MNKYELFWEWFLLHEEEYFLNIENNMEDLVPQLQEKLWKINDNLAFEISELLENNTREFIISADGIYSAFKDVEQLYDYRLDLSKWRIVPFRPREEVITHSIELDGLTVSYDDIFFNYEVKNNLIYIQVYIENYDSIDNRYVHSYFLLLDSLIGEYDAVTMFAKTDIFPFDLKEATLKFYHLKMIVDDLKKSDF
jgi:hypothetical protein